MGNTLTTFGQWQMVTTVRSGTTFFLYLNGVLKQTGTTTATSPVTTFDLAADGGTLLNGQEDSVRVYNRALSAAEIQALYNSEK